MPSVEALSTTTISLTPGVSRSWATRRWTRASRLKLTVTATILGSTGRSLTADSLAGVESSPLVEEGAQRPSRNPAP